MPSIMINHGIYKDTAKYYDLIYHWKDYRKEASKIKALIRQYQKSKGNALLEVACGTGGHLRYLKKDFSCLAVDIDADMLAVARRKIKGVPFRQADMMALNLNKEFDAVVCLFSSIGHVKTYGNLKKTIQNFARHLKPGGVVIFEPWFTKEAYKAGSLHLVAYESDDIKIARITVSEKKGPLAVLNMNYLVAEKGRAVKFVASRHALGLFDIDKTLALMRQSGLAARFLKKGLMKQRGLFIGIKH